MHISKNNQQHRKTTKKLKKTWKNSLKIDNIVQKLKKSRTVKNVEKPSKLSKNRKNSRKTNKKF